MYSLDEQTRPVKVEGVFGVDQYWHNMPRGVVAPFVTFKVVNGRMSRVGYYKVNTPEGELEMMVELAPVPGHLVSDEARQNPLVCPGSLRRESPPRPTVVMLIFIWWVLFLIASVIWVFLRWFS